MTYHVGVKSGTPYLYNGYVEYTQKDFWTSVKLDHEESTFYIRYLTKANLMKQIAKDVLGNIRLWKRVELDSIDLIVEEVK